MSLDVFDYISPSIYISLAAENPIKHRMHGHEARLCFITWLGLIVLHATPSMAQPCLRLPSSFFANFFKVASLLPPQGIPSPCGTSHGCFPLVLGLFCSPINIKQTKTVSRAKHNQMRGNNHKFTMNQGIKYSH